jgi:hypothetical protein
MSYALAIVTLVIMPYWRKLPMTAFDQVWDPRQRKWLFGRKNLNVYNLSMVREMFTNGASTRCTSRTADKRQRTDRHSTYSFETDESCFPFLFSRVARLQTTLAVSFLSFLFQVRRMGPFFSIGEKTRGSYFALVRATIRQRGVFTGDSQQQT